MADTKNVTTSKPKIGGAVYRAPVGTTLPTDATTALNEAFVCLGYISEDGLTNANSPDGDKIKAWVVELILNGVLKRVVVPKAKITEMDDIVYADEEALGYDITITATPDTDGNTHYEYMKEKTA